MANDVVSIEERIKKQLALQQVQMSTSLGKLIDDLYKLRGARLELSREVDELKRQEAMMRARIMEELDEVGLARASGSEATAGITQTIQPYVEDWEQVMDYVFQNKAYNLLQHRISAPAWREMVESGVYVPGTLVTEVRDISLTKARK